MAEEVKVTPEQTPETPEVPETPETPEVPETPPEDKKGPTVQELMVELAKVKRQADKNASEAKEWKEKFRSTQSEKEIMDAEKAEAAAKREEEFNDMKKRLEINDLTENFMDLRYPKDLARKAATAQVEGDTQALLEYQKQFLEAERKTWEADYLKGRPEIQLGGTGTSYTKEQFDQMSLVEKTKLKRENEAEYNRLLAL